MANIIDALIVTLGMDASGFRSGTKAVGENLDKTRKEADRTAKDIEASGKRAAQFVNSLKAEFIGLFAAITAGKGLTSFISDSITGTAALGRMAANLNLSARELDGWGRAAESFGGTAEGVRNSMQGIASGIQQFALTGNSELIPIFRTLGVAVSDSQGKVRDYREIMLDVADRLKGMKPQEALAFGKMLGLDDGTINLLRQGRAGVQDLVNEFIRASGVTEQSVQTSQHLQKEWALFNQQMAGVGQTVYEALGPALELAVEDLGELSRWLSEHRGEISEFFVAGVHAIEDLVGAFKALDEATDGNASKTALAVAGMMAMATALGAIAAGMRTVIGLGASTAASLARAVPVGAAGWAGWEIGSAINKRYIEPNEDLSDKIGGTLNTIVAEWGWGQAQKDAQEALDNHFKAMLGESSTAPSAASGSNLPRGIRNNNPGNLNFAGQAGATKEGGPKGRFAVFATMEEGVVALIRQLRRYSTRGIDTLRKLVNMYAPGSDGNDVGAYIKALSGATGKGADDKLDLDNQQELFGLLKGIMSHENGSGYVSDAQILKGIQVGAGASPLAARGAGGDTRIQSETNIQKIEIVTQATDARGIARDLRPAMGDQSLGSLSTRGDS